MVVLSLLIYVTSIDSNSWHLCKPVTFASIKVYCVITLICLIILISHITKLLLIHKFCFHPGSHIFFKYARYNHLRWPMIGEVSLSFVLSVTQTLKILFPVFWSFNFSACKAFICLTQWSSVTFLCFSP